MAKILAHYVRVIYSNLLAHGSRNLWGVYFLLFFLVGSLFIYAVPAHAASVPQLINYQGVLTDRDGNRRNGPFDIRFSIWDNPTLTDAVTHKVWPASDGDEHLSVNVRRGVFSVLIGGGSASGTLSAEVFAHDDNYSSDDRYLQIEVKHGVTYEILWPRSRITSMGYAFNADRVQGQGSGDNIFPSFGNVGIGTTSPSGSLEVSHDGVSPDLVVASDGNVGIGTAGPQNKLDVEGEAAIGATYSGTNTAPSNGLLVEGNVGIGTTEPTAKLEVFGEVKSVVNGVEFYMVPRGTIVMWSGALADIPAMWALCNGCGNQPYENGCSPHRLHRGFRLRIHHK